LSPNDVLAWRRFANADAPKVRRGLDWLKDNYGNSGGRMGQIYSILQKTGGGAAQELLRKWSAQRMTPSTSNKGVRGRSTSSKMTYAYPQIVKMLQDFIDQRNKYHEWQAANPYTVSDAIEMSQYGL
jgi:hypothetical protein